MEEIQDQNQLTDIVRRIVLSMQSLPDRQTTGSNVTSTNGLTNNLVHSVSGNQERQISVEQEISQRFQIPRGSEASVRRPPPRSGSGRFVPYSTNKKGKGKGKSKPSVELVIKDVCLLPDPQYCTVPRRQMKEDLVTHNLYVDAWTLDKVWCEERLRNNLHDIFKQYISNPSQFEYVKSVGSRIVPLKLPHGQEASAKVIKHISGTGPIYIRTLSKLEIDEDEAFIDLESENSPKDVRTYFSPPARNTSMSSTSHLPSTSELPSTSQLPSTTQVPCVSQLPSTSHSITSSQLSDYEKQHLVEMFPTCPQHILTEASKQSAIELACAYVMDFWFDFAGEPAIDGGEPKREFFTILLRKLLSSSACIRLFEGRNNIFLLMHNTDALRSNLYKVAGRMVASSIIQGGPGFRNFPIGIYKYFQKQEPNELIDFIGEEDVVDADCLEVLDKLDGMKEDNKSSVIIDVQPMLIESGFPHPLSLENQFQAMTSLVLHSVILSRKAEVDQFMDGLGSLLPGIKNHPKQFESLFVAGACKPPSSEDARLFVDTCKKPTNLEYPSMPPWITILYGWISLEQKLAQFMPSIVIK